MEPKRASKYIVRGAEVKTYSPANHTGTVNRRIIGQETVNAKGVEVVLGTVSKGHGALPHSHPGIEQVCYMLEGRARVEVDGVDTEIGPGDACYFPADMPHIFTAVTDTVRVIVIYTPPYQESPEKGVARH